LEQTESWVLAEVHSLYLASCGTSIYPEIFSYCLVPFSSSTTNTSTFFLGSPLGFKLHRHLVYTPIVDQTFSPLYYVGLTGISVNGTSLLNNIPPDTFHINKTTHAGGVMLDSGGAFTYLNTVAYTAVSQVSVLICSCSNRFQGLGWLTYLRNQSEKWMLTAEHR
jgi:hypothetical protein